MICRPIVQPIMRPMARSVLEPAIPGGSMPAPSHLEQLLQIYQNNPSLPGAIFDCSDMSTMFQDAAGTTPVTALGQPVGLHLDISGRGNHRSQTVTARRPLYSAKVNLVPRTHGAGMLGAAWNTTDFATGGPSESPLYTNVAATATASTPTLQFNAPQTSLRFSVYFKQGSMPSQAVVVRNGTAGVNLSISTIDYATGNSSGPAQVQNVGNGWWKMTIDQTTGISVGNAMLFYVGFGGSQPEGSNWNIAAPSVVGIQDVAFPFQRVTSLTDYEDVGYYRYLQYDAVDDWLSIPTYDITPNFALFTAFRSERNTGQSSPAALAPVSYPGLLRIMNPNAANAVSVITFAGANNASGGYSGQAGAWADRLGKNTVVGHVTNWTNHVINRCEGDEQEGTASQGDSLPDGHTKAVIFGAYGSGAGLMQGREYGAALLNKFLTPSEITTFETWLTSQYGGVE